ncbi:Glutathione gamma-glutamylcysteinyltransferase 2 [Raphanus sativus]|nr:Glutathione gamma-glutamylcysteinyltransferase 2 [Raphanus sativus]
MFLPRQVLKDLKSYLKQNQMSLVVRKNCVKCIKGVGEDKGKAYPSGNDVFTALLLALPPQTWSGIKDQSLLQEMKQLISMVSFPTLLQQEVLHLRRQLQLLKRCQENKEDEDLSAPA